MPPYGLRWTYAAVKALIRGAMLLITRTQVCGREFVPRHGAAVVVCNHIAAVDPAILVGVFPRPLALMSKIENDRGILRPFMRMVGAFTVRRGQFDRRALRMAEQILQGGRLLCLFPEGSRDGGALMSAHGGAALLAHRAQVPVLPVAITGTAQIFRHRFPWLGFPRVTVTIGQPIWPGAWGGAGTFSQPERAHFTQQIMQQIAGLLPPEMRGHYRQME